MTNEADTHKTKPEISGFSYYDPYLTYSDTENDCFIDLEGMPCKELNPDTRALFRIGNEAFKRLTADVECDAEEFVLGYAAYRKGLEEFRAVISESLSTGRLILSDGKKPIPAPTLDDMSVVSIAWQMYSAPWSKAKADGEIRSVYQVLFLFHALKEVDNALIGLALGGSDPIVAAIEAANALSNAVAIESNDEHLVEARRRLGYEASIEKLKHDPKQREKQFVRECWNEWQKTPGSYKSKASFARDMLNKCEHLVSVKKIEDWCRQWEVELLRPPG
jgi:hypothetical protein